MVGTGRNVIVKDGRGSCVDVGNGLLNNNNVVLIVIAIIILSCFCGGNNAFIGSCGCGRRRRRGRDRGLNNLLFLLLPLLFLRGGNSGPNTNTNIINVDPLLDDDDGGGFLNL